MFKVSMWQVEEKIKEHSYIAEVKLKRNLSGKINIEVTERISTFMIKLENRYAYVNNQGYILELSTTPLALPSLEGLKTDISNLEPKNRLIEEDLLKLNTCIQIMEVASFNNIDTLITSINLLDDKSYILNLEKENKVVRFGDSSKVNQKMSLITEVIKQEKGSKGEIYFKDEKIDRAIFKEKV